MYRTGVNKGKSAKSFKKAVSKTKALNLRQGPARGGIRL